MNGFCGIDRQKFWVATRSYTAICKAPNTGKATATVQVKSTISLEHAEKLALEEAKLEAGRRLECHRQFESTRSWTVSCPDHPLVSVTRTATAISDQSQADADATALELAHDAANAALVCPDIINSVSVPATACLYFAYAPSGYTMPNIDPSGDSVDHIVSNGGETPEDYQPVVAPVILPIPSWVKAISITATGQWFWGPDYLLSGVGPDGSAGAAAVVHPDYFSSGLNSLGISIPSELRPPVYASATGAHPYWWELTASVNDQYGKAFHSQQLVGLWINPSKSGSVFAIGSNFGPTPVPPGTTGLALGFMGNYGWNHYTGSVSAQVAFKYEPS